MSTQPDEPPVWNAQRIEEWREVVRLTPDSELLRIRWDLFDALLDELEGARRERDEIDGELEEVIQRREYIAQCFHVAVHGTTEAKHWRDCDRPTCRGAHGD